MGEGSDASWRGTSADQRSDERRQRLLASGYDIVGQYGIAALTVRAVCSAANVGPRYFSESFADIGELLAAIYDFAVAELLTAVAMSTESAPPVPLSRRIQANLAAAADFLTRRPACGRIIFSEALASPALRARAASTLPQFIGAVRRGLDDPAAKHISSERDRLETAVLSGALTMAFADWLARPGEVSQQALVEYCTDATLAILALSAGGAG